MQYLNILQLAPKFLISFPSREQDHDFRVNFIQMHNKITSTLIISHHSLCDIYAFFSGRALFFLLSIISSTISSLVCCNTPTATELDR